MAKFLFWSDLHCEFDPFDIPTPGVDGAPEQSDIDGILVAGDIDTKGRHLDWLERIWTIWQRPVLAIAGNHEPYGAKRFQKHHDEERGRLAQLRSAGVDIDVMRGSTRIIGDTRVIGATLWTDMNLYPAASGYIQHIVKDKMNDYRHVKWHDERSGIYRKMIPADTVSMHRTELEFILAELSKPFEGRTVVMTHHAPILQVLSKARRDAGDLVSAAYASDLWNRIGYHSVDAWISGHTHDGVEVALEGACGQTAFLSNCRGYPSEKTRFNPFRVLDSSDPLLGSTIDPSCVDRSEPLP